MEKHSELRHNSNIHVYNNGYEKKMGSVTQTQTYKYITMYKKKMGIFKEVLFLCLKNFNGI